MRGCRPLSQAEVAQLTAAFRGPYAARDRALFLLGVLSGFRISELLSLRLGDVVQRGRLVGRVQIARRYMKRHTEGRSVLLHPRAKEALARWIEDLRSQGYMTPECFVFQSRSGANRPLSRAQAWRILRRAFENEGLTGSLGTHSMRKTFADRMYERLGGDLVKLQKALGHRSILSTASYVSFREEEIEEAILAL